jgi:hypothetical protein
MRMKLGELAFFEALVSSVDKNSRGFRGRIVVALATHCRREAPEEHPHD